METALTLPLNDLPDPVTVKRTSNLNSSHEVGETLSDFTTEPFVPVPNDGFVRPKTKKQRNWENRDRKICQRLPLQELFQKESNFSRFHVITFPGVDVMRGELIASRGTIINCCWSP